MATVKAQAVLLVLCLISILIAGSAFAGPMSHYIEQDRALLSQEERKHTQYYTLYHLRGRDEEVLQVYRDAFRFTLNSLSWREELYWPRQVDEQGYVYAVDTRRLWKAKSARKIPKINILQTIVEPSVEANQVNERDYADVLNFDATDYYLGQEIVVTLESYAQRLGAYPIDVFIQTVTRGEQYYDLMEMGSKHGRVERFLGVDVDANIRNDNVLRAGTDHPGPSMANRMVERHEVDYGNGNLSYLWLSYDFEIDGDDNDNDFFATRGDGPQEGAVFNRAFFPDGGESIFGLPNGLQGYALYVWATDDLLTTGPNNVVRANDGVFTDPTVGNAIYCMACHSQGMNPVSSDLYDHEVAAFEAGWRTLEEMARVNAVYGSTEVNAAIGRDTERYLDALARLGVPYGDIAAEAVNDYMLPVRLDRAAAELGLTKAELNQCGLEQTDNRMQSYYLRLAGPGLPRSRWAFAYPAFLKYCTEDNHTLELSYGDG